ncbi:MAG: hypothetical protein U0L34_00175 [Paludibacteraceae bacterium]|nr:hypothetical protein [Paludibacteraceae bacterium]
MKRIITLLIVSCAFLGAMAQSQIDSLMIYRMEKIYEKLDNSVPRYKIYPTENFNIQLKLDTATGKVWMVQISLGDSDAMVVPVDETSVLYDFEDVRAGRFELYPTKNMHNFILLDTKYGYTYQVQWSVDKEKRIRIPIY